MANLTNENVSYWLLILHLSPEPMSYLDFFWALFLPSFLPSSAKGPPGFSLNISYIRNFIVFGSVVLERGCSCLEMANIDPKSFVKSGNVFLVFLSRTVPNAFLSRGHPFLRVLTPCFVESSIERKLKRKYLNS